MNQYFHQELGELYTEIAKLGGMVEESIGKAMASFTMADKVLARDVRTGDDKIDKLEVEIEERCLNMLALYQPVARDLRFLVTALKVNNELEHIGDLAESIARKARKVPKSKVENSKMELMNMGESTQKMVSLALDAFLKEDSKKAWAVIHMDDEIDKFHAKHHRIISQDIESDERSFSIPELKMLSVSRSLERMADLATSIAEDVIYFVEGNIVRHRPRDDDNF